MTLRTAAVIASGLVLAAPATAAAPKPGTFVAPEGKVELGYDLEFKVSKNGKRITDLAANVLERCSGSSMSTVTTIGPELSWKIRNGKFKGRKKERYGALSAYTTLKGRFVTPGKAKGIVRQETIVAGSTCDTYELDFVAKRR